MYETNQNNTTLRAFTTTQCAYQVSNDSHMQTSTTRWSARKSRTVPMATTTAHKNTQQTSTDEDEGHVYLLTTICGFTKYCFATPMKSKCTYAIKRALYAELFCQVGAIEKNPLGQRSMLCK